MSGWRWMHACGVALGCAALLAGCTSDDDVDGESQGRADSGAAGASRAMDAGAAPVECTVTAPAQCPDPPVRYGDVEPIFMERCVPCHLGEPGGPWGLTSYAHAASWFAEIRSVMLSCQMPPADAGIPMSDGEREELLTWIRCGFPQ